MENTLTFDVAGWITDPQAVLLLIQQKINQYLGERHSGIVVIEFKDVFLEKQRTTATVE